MSVARLLAPAERELWTAMRWYEAQRPGLGAEFVGAVHSVMARVGAKPTQFPVWDHHPGFRRALVPRFPYARFFHAEAGDPVVCAVAHTSRRPGYWITRVETPEER